jgi:hypothetical protein
MDSRGSSPIGAAISFALNSIFSRAIFTDILDFAREFSPFKAARGDR